jgi:hypothetical protein
VGRAAFAGGNVAFNSATFASGTVTFNDARFAGGTVTFNMPEFTGGRVTFDRAEFIGGVVRRAGPEFRGGHVARGPIGWSGCCKPVRHDLRVEFAHLNLNLVRVFQSVQLSTSLNDAATGLVSGTET